MNFVTKKSFLMKLIIAMFLVTFILNNVLCTYSYGGVLINAIVGGSVLKSLCMAGGALLIAVNGILGVVLNGIGNTYEEIMNQDTSDPQFRKTIG